MVKNEKVLEELYELLGLYFATKLPGGIVEYRDGEKEDPILSSIEVREKILARITSLIMENYIFEL